MVYEFIVSIQAARIAPPTSLKDMFLSRASDNVHGYVRSLHKIANSFQISWVKICPYAYYFLMFLCCILPQATETTTHNYS
jgi:hypothetical protein